jgi:hypothetical protein
VEVWEWFADSESPAKGGKTADEVPDRERVVDLERVNPFNDKDRGDDKRSILEVKACNQSGATSRGVGCHLAWT